MKVLMLNGSPKANGNTALALAEIEKIFLQGGIDFFAVLCYNDKNELVIGGQYTVV